MKSIKKVLIIGSGPIVIGQAAEFDYSGTQACLTLREKGVKVILVNSNPATIQTDTEVADTVYIEPLTSIFLEKIIAKESPDGIIPTVGGQTGLNLATELHQKGILQKYKVAVLGTDMASICLGESREKFKNLMEQIRQPILPSCTVHRLEEGLNFAKKVGMPLIIRSAYNLGGTGSSIVTNLKILKEKLAEGLKSSFIGEVLLEKSMVGLTEMEYEIIRDSVGNKVMVCNMENLDPLGVHTGESIVIAPSQTLSDRDHQLLRSAAFQIADALNIQGSCNVQFAINQKTGEYFVIEVNPRLSRSSALASKATGYPIAKVATKIALGEILPEIKNEITGKTAFFEPALDYVVVKIPRWPDDKFPTLNKTIGVTMKSTGEVMAIGRNFEEAAYKAIQSLDLKEDIFKKFRSFSPVRIKNLLKIPNMNRLGAIFAAFNFNLTDSEISKLTQIHPWFIFKLRKLFKHQDKVFSAIKVYKMVDTCAGEFEAKTPYFYSASGQENEAQNLPGPKVIILGSGPIRIGQGIEFDYLTVHAIKALKKKRIKALIINNNPETVSTDYAVSDRLYFEPLTYDFAIKAIKNEKNGLLGVIPQFGGQTALNLAILLADRGIKILGTGSAAIKAAENRKITAKLLEKLGYDMPRWAAAQSKQELLNEAEALGFPVMIRPSFVLGGEGMMIAKNKKEVISYAKNLPNDFFEKPILIDQFLSDGKELDIDFLSDGKNTVSFILEQLDPAGTHSGDSHCVFPVQNISPIIQKRLKEMTAVIAKAFAIRGLGNLQAVLKDDKIFILEINPRASRTVPFLSKCLGISLAQLATDIILGGKLPKLPRFNSRLVSIKKPIFSFEKLDGLSPTLGPLMKSTGEEMSIGRNFEEAVRKSNANQVGHKKLDIYPFHKNRN